MKITKTHVKALHEIMHMADKNGCVAVGDWTSGSGRFTTNRALPPFCQRFEKKKYAPTALPQHGTMERTAYQFFEGNPRRRAVIVIDKEAMIDALWGVEI